MIILDTNVVSEPLRARGDLNVIAWLDRQVTESLYLTATSLAELLVDIQALPSGKRKAALAGGLAALIERLFESCILPFDQATAGAYASIIGRARSEGHAIAMADGQIAAIAAVHGFTVVTRDATPFIAAGTPVIDPWKQ